MRRIGPSPQDPCDGCPCPRRELHGRPLDLPAALAALPGLAGALAVTTNRVVVMGQSGRYAPPERIGEALRGTDPGRVGLRVDPARLRARLAERADGERQLLLEDAASTGPVATGEASHRAATRDPFDTLLLEGAGAGWPTDPGIQAASSSAPGGDWRDAGQLEQIDALIGGQGAERRRRMPREYRSGAVSIVPAVLPGLADLLCRSGIPLSALVIAPGLAHRCDGRIRMAAASRPRGLGIVLDGATLDIDLSTLRELLVVVSEGPHGPTAALELHGPDGDVALLLTQLGPVPHEVHAAWEDAVRTLVPAL